MIRLLNEGNELRELDEFDSEHPKYILDWNDSIDLEGHTTLYRIIYKSGHKGGFLESYDNLSQKGKAKVYGNAQVSDSAEVFGDAEVFGKAKVCGDAWVYGYARVSGNDVIKTGEVTD